MTATNTTKKNTRTTKGKQAIELIEKIKEHLGYDLYNVDDYFLFRKHSENKNFTKAENEKEDSSLKDTVENLKNENETLKELIEEDSNESKNKVEENNNY
ncbi:hypothetical protein ACKRLN_08940 (plasmid) [Anaerococcus sp. DFU013_CI05]|uniref:hypothetical protein n=1 Tax=Anaerococcus sp. AH8042_DFU013_CI05 TaxID=3385202 RepID=UPI003A523086